MHSPIAIRRGILLMIAGSSVFATNDAFSKLALGHIPPSEVLAVRGVMAMLVLGLTLGMRGELASLRFGFDRRVLLRSVTEAGVATLFITAIITMSIADASAILQITPLATMAAAVLLFGARIGVQRWLAVLVGFLGVTMIIKPGSSAFDPTAFLPLAAAFLMAFRDFVTGRIGTHVPTLIVTFMTALAGMTIGFAGSAVETWRPLDLVTMAYLAGGAITMVAGHMLTIAAFRGNDPATIAPFRYAAVVSSVALSAFIFSEMPDLISIGGMALITAAGLFTMHSHRSAARAARPAAEVAEREAT